MISFKRFALAGCATAAALLIAACSGPDKQAESTEFVPVVQQGEDPNVQVIELPAPAGAKPGEKVRAVITPYPPGSPEAKEAVANALRNADKNKQP
ncbi:MAG: hypothetical protein RBU21_19240 [FCB group bacterium]|nr:hypothetical protein [FCB group bacterium]